MLSTIALVAMVVGGSPQGTQIRASEAPRQLPIGDWRSVDAGGGFVFEYSFWWKPFEHVSPDHEVFPWDICSFQCKVKLHESHPKCDFSCDEQCETEHKSTIDPIWQSNLSSLYSWLAETLRLNSNTKIPWSFKSRGLGTTDAVVADFQQFVIAPATTGTYASEAAGRFSGEHQKEPCGRVRFRYQLGRSTLVMKFKISHNISGLIDQGESQAAGYIYVPLPNKPREELEYGSGPCLCWDHSTKETSHLWVPDGTGLQPPGVWIDEGNTGKYVLAGAAMMERHGVQLTCPDMSQFEITASHPTMPISVLVTPGAVLKPHDPAFQDVLLSSRVLAKFAPLQDQFAATRFTYFAPPATGVAACLNMNKQMPTRATKFRAAMPADGRLAHLGRVGAEQVTFGPWDQARVWIYTEGASLEKVNEKMLLGVTTTQYVGELYNLEKKVGVDLRTPKFRSCFAPSHLLGKAGAAAPIEWYASKISELDAAGVADFLNDRRSDFGQLLSGLEVARQRLHTISLLNGLLKSNSASVQLAALKLLNEHADPAELAILMANRGLGWAGRLLRSKDPAVAQESLVVFERLGHPYALSFLPKTGAAHPELRARVASLNQKLEVIAKG